MLCSACRVIFTGTDRPWYYRLEANAYTPAYSHHPSPARLARAVEEKCHICTIIWRKLEPSERTLLESTWSNSYLYWITQNLQRLWSTPLACYTWSPVWYGRDDIGIRFQFGDKPAWRTIVFRIMPTREECDDEEFVVQEELVSPVSPASPNRTGVLVSSFQQRHTTTYSMWTPRIQSLVKRWYTVCTESHEHCRAGYEHPHPEKKVDHKFQPTRILDLSSNKIRLDCSPADRKDQRYASLTHRWSIYPETMPRLSFDKLSKWEEEIDPSILTETFRDAIAVARQLGVRYLWVDSLCIVQTGFGWEEDWQVEAARMGEVYRHAILNIQAGRDTDAGPYGLFKTPATREIEPFKISINREFHRPMIKSMNGRQIPIKVEGDFWIVEEDFARDELIGNPINRRGWVLQERILSHRIVHFGPQQVFWECRELLACETFPEGLPKTIPHTLARAATRIERAMTMNFDPSPPTRSLTSRLLSPAKTLPLPSFPALTCHKDLFGWFYLAELYSACSLTRETDKLVAISGLAQIISQSPSSMTDNRADVVQYLRSLALPRTGGAISEGNWEHSGASRPASDYLAGLWKYDIVPCLLWHVLDGRKVNGTPCRRIEGEPSAPTWSWASINGKINASVYQSWGATTDGHYLVELNYAATTPVYPDLPWGQVSGGKIILTGRLIHEKDIRWPTADELEGTIDQIRAHHTEVVAKMLRRFTRNSASVARHRVLSTDVRCYLDDMDEFTSKLRRSGPSYEIALLPLVGLQRRRPAWDSENGYTDETHEYHGLVVVAKPMDGSFLAERLGYFRVNDTSVFGSVMARDPDKEIELI
jgi:hypothetical protein